MIIILHKGAFDMQNAFHRSSILPFRAVLYVYQQI